LLGRKTKGTLYYVGGNKGERGCDAEISVMCEIVIESFNMLELGHRGNIMICYRVIYLR